MSVVHFQCVRSINTHRHPILNACTPTLCSLRFFCLCVSLQARIKKIMQLDDDVGKVASSVPLLICIRVFVFIHAH